MGPLRYWIYIHIRIKQQILTSAMRGPVHVINNNYFMIGQLLFNTVCFFCSYPPHSIKYYKSLETVNSKTFVSLKSIHLTFCGGRFMFKKTTWLCRNTIRFWMVLKAAHCGKRQPNAALKRFNADGKPDIVLMETAWPYVAGRVWAQLQREQNRWSD